ncbi:hypothetical protein HW115_00065 [Verrucomicrobiaceae bacterium N1E253]|uniref:DUF4350 domain-containing protein n=1 Tax=Oceaniferula marina TaxID=2748318 RepID=A0A851G8E7_9BACT|nr:DUF4350 domain-containing protein [Oceaniferula marina]NWK53988.1 hypothetical protein [Oceaniferula marina]
MLAVLVGCGKTEKKRRTLGYKGEAGVNPFLAAQRFLRNDGWEVDSQHGVGYLTEEISTLFIPPSSIHTEGRAKRLMQWVSEGGHLVIMLDAGELSGDDFVKNPSSWSWLDMETSHPGLDYLSSELEVELVEWEHQRTDASIDPESLDLDEWEVMEEKDRVLLGSEKSEIMLEGAPMAICHWSEQGVQYSELMEAEFGSGEESGDEKHRYLSETYLHGRVTWMTDARPIRNRYIAYADHAQFLHELCALSRPGMIVFASGGGDGLFDLIWRYYPLAVVTFLLAVVFWLWLHLPRFGPVQGLPEGGMREYLSLMRGMGRFFWKYKRDDVMLSAMRSAVSRNLSMQPGASQEGIFEQLAEKSGISEEEVIEAMTRENVHEPGVMVRITRNLQKMMQHLTNNKQR